jgi:hypothetical protein
LIQAPAPRNFLNFYKLTIDWDFMLYKAVSQILTVKKKTHNDPFSISQSRDLGFAFNIIIIQSSKCILNVASNEITSRWLLKRWLSVENLKMLNSLKLSHTSLTHLVLGSSSPWINLVIFK